MRTSVAVVPRSPKVFGTAVEQYPNWVTVFIPGNVIRFYGRTKAEKTTQEWIEAAKVHAELSK